MATAPDYRYLACNALTGSVVDEIPLVGETWSRVLNDAGTLQGNIPLDGKSALRVAQLLADAEPGAINMVVERNGNYVWTGLLTSHGDYDSEAGQLPITAIEWFDYCNRRFYVSGANNSLPTFLTDDIANLANTFVTSLFNDGGPPYQTSIKTAGVSTTMAFNWYEQHKLSDLLTSLASMVPGFDFSFDATADVNGNPLLQFAVSAPRRGVSSLTSGIVFDYPGGGVLSYKVKKEASRFATDVIATGAGSGETLLVARSQAPLSGYVKQTSVANNKDLAAQDQVNSFSDATLAAYGKQPPFTPNLTVKGTDFFNQGVNTGDEFLFVVSSARPDGTTPADYYFPNGTAQALRCVGYTVTPGSDGSGGAPETVQITCGSVVSF